MGVGRGRIKRRVLLQHAETPHAGDMGRNAFNDVVEKETGIRCRMLKILGIKMHASTKRGREGQSVHKPEFQTQVANKSALGALILLSQPLNSISKQQIDQHFTRS